MIIKNQAPRTGKFFDLKLISAAINGMNHNGENKFYMRIIEKDETPDDMSTPIMLNIELVCNNTIIHAKTLPIERKWSSDMIAKMVPNIEAKLIVDCIQSGLVNYQLMNDQLVESYSASALGQDRISIIKKIIKHDPNNYAGLSRKWSWYDKADGAEEGVGAWEVMEMLEAPYEDLIKCLDELVNGLK